MQRKLIHQLQALDLAAICAYPSLPLVVLYSCALLPCLHYFHFFESTFCRHGPRVQSHERILTMNWSEEYYEYVLEWIENNTWMTSNLLSRPHDRNCAYIVWIGVENREMTVVDGIRRSCDGLGRCRKVCCCLRHVRYYEKWVENGVLIMIRRRS